MKNKLDVVATETAINVQRMKLIPIATVETKREKRFKDAKQI